jgi:hypothetical protein
VKSASLIAIGLAASVLFSLQLDLKAAEGTTKFDGAWAVSVEGKAYKNGDGTIGQPWVKNFTTTVKNGALHGEFGTRGKPAWFELTGNIAADGTASLLVNELTGDRQYNFSRSKGPPGKRASYSFQGTAHFEAKHGTGRSTSDDRTRIFTFLKEE